MAPKPHSPAMFGGPAMGIREDVMRAQGIYECTDWCDQADDEHECESHWSDPVQMKTSLGTEYVLRFGKAWGDQADAQFGQQMELIPPPGGISFELNAGDWDEVQKQIDAHMAYAGIKPAWDGAAQAAAEDAEAEEEEEEYEEYDDGEEG